MPLHPLFPDAPALRLHEIEASGGHRLHVREWGCDDGLPALLLHGGPGSGATPVLWRCFDPARYRVIVPDQRGAGLSRPRGQVEHNTLAELLADLRALREHLGIDRWLVVGGSWGATLALAHVLDQPDAATGVLLRAPFLARAQDIHHFFDQTPAGLAEVAAALHATASPRTGQSLLAALHEGLLGPDRDRQAALARAWWRWERSLALGRNETGELVGDELARQIDRLRVQTHFLAHACWLDAPHGEPLLDRLAARPPAVPVHLVQGRADRICPPAGAQGLHTRLPGSSLQWIDHTGHDPTHPGMVDAMVAALASWAARGAWPQPIATAERASA